MNDLISKYYEHRIQIIVQIQDILANINLDTEMMKGNIVEDDAKALLNFLSSDNIKPFVQESFDEDANEVFVQLPSNFGRHSQHVHSFLAENPIFLQYEICPSVMDMNDTTYHIEWKII